MSFIRPEIRALLHRWREVIAGEGVFLLGLYWAVLGGGILPWLGGVLMLTGLALTFVGIQRARFRGGSGGPGVVQVDEGQITYFGPLTGGALAVADLDRLMLDTRGKPAHWVLTQPSQPPLHIPVTAEGADALFDAFSALPGLRTGAMLTALRRADPRTEVIWQRGRHTALGDLR